MRPPLVLFVLCLLMFGLSPTSSAREWISSASLQGLTSLSAADRQRIGAIVESRNIASGFGDKDIAWQIRKGDLTVPGNFDNAHALIVDGDLKIEGTYDDYREGGGFLIVLGDFAAEHVFTWNDFYVHGTLTASGLVYGSYNDFTFEVDGGVNARGIVMHDHSSDYQAKKTEFELDSHGWPEEAQTAKALRLMVPDVFTSPSSLELDDDAELYTLWPDYETTKAIVYAGQPIFRATPAGQSVVDDARIAVAADSSDEALLAILGKDKLIDRLVAARYELSKKVTDALLALDDPGVHAWLAGTAVTDLGQLGGSTSLTAGVAERLAANPQTPMPTLLAIARSEDAAVRQHLAWREDLPDEVLRLLIRDSDAEIRANVLSFYDNAERLPEAEKARLANDPDPSVREALAVADLPAPIAAKLAADPNSAVRLRLAASLAPHIDRPDPAMKETERHQLAESLWADTDKEVAAAVFLALPSSRQVAIYRQGQHRLHWDDIAEGTRSVGLMRALLEREDNLEVQGSLAKNPALPLALQRVIVQRAAKPGPTCDECWLHETTDDVLSSLLGNDNVAPQALVDASKIAVRRPDAGFINELTHNKNIPLEGLEILDDRWAGTEDWSLSVILMHHASRKMLERALPRWYEKRTITDTIRAMRKLSDSAWWRALAQSEVQELREAAATNVNTPADLLRTLLNDPSDEVAGITCFNPQLPSDARKAVAHKGFGCLLADPLISLQELADYARSAPTYDVRSAALAAYTLRKLRP